MMWLENWLQAPRRQRKQTGQAALLTDSQGQYPKASTRSSSIYPASSYIGKPSEVCIDFSCVSKKEDHTYGMATTSDGYQGVAREGAQGGT